MRKTAIGLDLTLSLRLAAMGCARQCEHDLPPIRHAFSRGPVLTSCASIRRGRKSLASLINLHSQTSQGSRWIRLLELLCAPEAIADDRLSDDPGCGAQDHGLLTEYVHPAEPAVRIVYHLGSDTWIHNVPLDSQQSSPCFELLTSRSCMQSLFLGKFYADYATITQRAPQYSPAPVEPSTLHSDTRERY